MNAYVLAGGRSSRMGADKARLPHQGWPVAVHLVQLLERAGCRAFLVRRERDGLPWIRPDGSPIEVVDEDPSLPRHPLAGVYTARVHAGAPVFVVPCDVFGLTVDEIRQLVTQRAVALEHPLVGVFDASPAELSNAVQEGRSVRALVASRDRHPIGEVQDRNEPGDIGLTAGLRARLEGLVRVDAERAVEAERVRQRQRGVVEPPLDR